MRGFQEPCSLFRPTLKPSYCQCGFKKSDHDHDALPEGNDAEWKWGWRARNLAQPDSEDCE